jgi:ribosomal protein S18 acetylase RimI-like enzyme
MYISQVTKIEDSHVKVFQKLFPQLTTNRKPPSKAELEDIIASDSVILLISSEDKAGLQITGTLSLAFYKTPSGHHAWIEDVIVDEQYRGKGIGKALVKKAIELAWKRKANSVNLTSRPGRVAANKLYLKTGFEKRETNVYKYSFNDK